MSCFLFCVLLFLFIIIWPFRVNEEEEKKAAAASKWQLFPLANKLAFFVAVLIFRIGRHSLYRQFSFEHISSENCALFCLKFGQVFGT